MSNEEIFIAIENWLKNSISSAKDFYNTNKIEDRKVQGYQEILDKIESYRSGNDGLMDNICKNCGEHFQAGFHSNICDLCLLDAIY